MASSINADNGVVSGSSGLKSTADTSGVLALQSNGSTGVTLDTSLNVGIGTSSPTTLVDLVRSSTSGSDVSMPNLFVRNTSATQGNGSTTFNQSIVSVGAGNSTVVGGIRAAYDSAGSYGTGMQLYVNSTNPLQFYTNGSERMRLDSAGNLGLGVTPSAWVSNFKAFQVGTGGTFYGDYNNTTSYFGNNAYFNGTNWKYVSSSYALYAYQDRSAGKHVWAVAASGTAGNNITWTEAMTLDASGALILNNAGGDANMYFGGSSGTNRMYLARSGVDSLLINVETTGALRFGTNGTERARITSGGQVLIGSTTTVVNAGTTQLYVKTTGGDYASYFESTNTSPYGTYIKYSGAAPNSTGFEFLVCSDTSATRIQLRSNGGIGNYSANNVNLSDARTKTDIQDAGNYLAKICAIPVRTFKYKDQTDDLLNLGCIAQEVEAVAPELIDASGFGETPEDGVPLKAIYQTDLQYALMKCIQEQQAIIESLKARLDAANL